MSVTHNFSKSPTGWWRLALSGWWRLAVGPWRLVAVGGGWRRLAVVLKDRSAVRQQRPGERTGGVGPVRHPGGGGVRTGPVRDRGIVQCRGRTPCFCAAPLGWTVWGGRGHLLAPIRPQGCCTAPLTKPLGMHPDLIWEAPGWAGCRLWGSGGRYSPLASPPPQRAQLPPPPPPPSPTPKILPRLTPRPRR